MDVIDAFRIGFLVAANTLERKAKTLSDEDIADILVCYEDIQKLKVSYVPKTADDIQKLLDEYRKEHDET